jgi:deoxyribodipyrimidine photo-lyase
MPACRFNDALLGKDNDARENASWLAMHLEIRDFFVFTAMKHPGAIFEGRGVQGVRRTWKEWPEGFSKWAAGCTGFPFVDASMRELASTGFTSNRGRQNAASFLSKSLELDWRQGAQVPYDNDCYDNCCIARAKTWCYTAKIPPLIFCFWHATQCIGATS